MENAAHDLGDELSAKAWLYIAIAVNEISARRITTLRRS
jgi:hypothetical protein